MDTCQDINVSASGRIVQKRVMGHSSIVELDNKGLRTMVFISRDRVCPGVGKGLYNIKFKKKTMLGDTMAVVGNRVNINGHPYIDAKELHFVKVDF